MVVSPTRSFSCAPPGAIEREYSLWEIALTTRAAPARRLGLVDRGHLGVGARADIAIYADHPDRAKMFRSAALVFKDGELVAQDRKLLKQADLDGLRPASPERR